MQDIQYRYVTGDGAEGFVTVRSSGINTGFVKAIRKAREDLNDRVELNRIEFWMVVS